MALIDIILNLAGLLLWLNFRASHLSVNAPAAALSLASTLKRPEQSRANRWVSLGSLAALLFFRAVFYWDIGSALNWTAILSLGAITLPFRSDYFGRMLCYSLVSFLLSLGILYSWLLLLSAVNKRVPDTDFHQRLVRLHLGFCEKLPRAIKMLLPFTIALLAWVACASVLTRMGIMPAARSRAHLWQQALIIATSTFFVWKYLITGFLLLYVINTYVYLGNRPFWQFVSATGNNLIKPLKFIPLRIGRFDLAPWLEGALIFAAAEYGMAWLVKCYHKLPL
jgi:uncharacterized protein YggT (Ycf19 family)